MTRAQLAQITMNGKTLLDKIWDRHVVDEDANGRTLLYIDRHLMHEVTSPQAFDGIRNARRDIRRRQFILAVADHNVSTEHNLNKKRDQRHEERAADSKRSAKITYANSMRRIQSGTASALQMRTLNQNCNSNNIRYFSPESRHAGIVHVVGPEQGFVLPGLTVVCGDSHTSTNGALGCLAFGIGTTEVEHVLATQTLWQTKPKSMRIRLIGQLNNYVFAKDIILHIIRKLRISGATGHSIEFCGTPVETLNMDGRFTMCNMSIEGGARSAMVAVDDQTINFLQGRPLAPQGKMFEQAEQYWRTLRSDADAQFDTSHEFDISAIKPQVSWGTKPDQVADVDGHVPNPSEQNDPVRINSYQSALDYMGLKSGEKITDIEMDRVFIGSCTNARLQDIRQIYDFVRDCGKAVTRKRTPCGSEFKAIIVPSSRQVSEQAIDLGYGRELERAGFEWRLPGCSMCLGMNDDVVGPRERCASTSNRNFEGRQGYLARTHLVSPVMAAAVATVGKGHFVDISTA